MVADSPYRFNKCRSYVLTSACLAAMLLVGSAAQAAVGDYGVMWSFQVPDGGTSFEQANNGIHSGGYANGGTYISSWQHSSTFPPTSSGGRTFIAGRVDNYGRLDEFYNAGPAVGGQLYQYGIHVSGDTVLLAGNAENTDYVAGTTGSGFYPFMSAWTDINGANTQTRGQARYQDAAESLIVGTNGGRAWSFGAHIDADGNYYSVGQTNQTLGSGTIAYNGTNVAGSNTSDYDPFIIKYNSSGAIVGGIIEDIGALPGGNTGTQYGYFVRTDSAGNIFSGGRGDGDILGDGGDTGVNGYVVKYDSSFNRQWIVELGTSAANDRIYDARIDGNGDVFVSGISNDNAFIAKLNGATGATIWSDTIGTQGGKGADVEFDADGNIWLVGNTLDDLTGEQVGDRDNFVRKYDPATGAVLETHQFGTVLEDRAQTVDFFQNNEIMFISGWTRGEYPDFLRADIPNAQPITHTRQAAIAIKYTVGDLNDDRYVDWDDMLMQMANPVDFTGNGSSDAADTAYFMEKIFESQFGDFNWDGRVDEADQALLDNNLGATERPAGWRGLFDGNIGQNEQDDLAANFGYVAGASLFGDLTGDLLVDFGDLTVLLAHWGGDNVGADAGNLVNTGTTSVDFADLTALLAAWTGSAGAPSPEAALAAGEAVPEPSTAVLAVLGLLGVLVSSRRRRRK